MSRREQHTRNDKYEYFDGAGGGHQENNKILLAAGSMTETSRTTTPTMELLLSSTASFTTRAWRIMLPTPPPTTTTTTTSAPASLKSSNDVKVYRRKLPKRTFRQVAVVVAAGWCAVTSFVFFASYDQQQKLMLKLQVQLNTVSLHDFNQGTTNNTTPFTTTTTFHGESSLSSASLSRAEEQEESTNPNSAALRGSKSNYSGMISSSIKSVIKFSPSIKEGDQPSGVGGAKQEESVNRTDTIQHQTQTNQTPLLSSANNPITPHARNVPELSFDQVASEAKSKAPKMLTRIGSYLMARVCREVWRGHTICPLMEQARVKFSRKTNPIYMYMEFNSDEIFKTSPGTGNYLTTLYGIRLAARVVGGVDVVMNCTDAENETSKRDYIMPWISGYFPESTHRSAMKDNITAEQACAPYGDIPVGYMLDDIKYDLRRMAIALLGIPHASHPAQQWAEKHLWQSKNGGSFANVRMQLSNPQPNDKPLLPNIDIDDAVIHFRCGDIMATQAGYFGFMSFYDMARHISTEARSIGIVTQPFDASGRQTRSCDVPQGDRCRVVVTALVAYLQKRHPGARISVHNNANESVALSFARMILANQTVAGVSSFSVYPAASTFGTGYIQQPQSLAESIVNHGFLNNPPISRFADNVVVLDPFSAITSTHTLEMLNQDPSGKVLLDWFEKEPDIPDLSFDQVASEANYYKR